MPFAFYEEKFRALNPEEALSRLPSVRWDGKEFVVGLLGREYAIRHPDYAICALDNGSAPTLPAQTFLLRYLLELVLLAVVGGKAAVQEVQTFLKARKGE